jgi:glucokinase
MAQGPPRAGIDLGGTKIQAAVVGDDGRVLGEARHPTPKQGGPPAVAAEMANAVREAASAAGVETDSLRGVGVGSPGDADETTGKVSAARNIPGWEGSFPLGDVLSETLGTKVRVGNDVQVATEAEFHLGAGKPYRSILGVFWGTGVGGGLILDGKPWLGRGAAGEIGHMVVKRGGARCPCGRRGCMEAYAGRGAMEAKARKEIEKGTHSKLFEIAEHHSRDRLSSGIWERALEQGDHLAERLMNRAVKALGTGIASACNLLDPEAVIFGGGMGLRFGHRYRQRLLAELHKHLFIAERPPAFDLAELGDLGGAIGASLLIARPAATAAEAGAG